MNLKLAVMGVAALAVAGLFLSASFTGRAPQKAAPAGLKEIVVGVGASEFSFDKAKIQLERGDEVKVTFRNTGQVIHNWVVPEFNAGTPIIGPGQQAETSFTVDRSGTFQFICTVPGHRERGMFGNLAVA